MRSKSKQLGMRTYEQRHGMVSSGYNIRFFVESMRILILDTSDNWSELQRQLAELAAV
jgi:hypothetical protein